MPVEVKPQPNTPYFLAERWGELGLGGDDGPILQEAVDYAFQNGQGGTVLLPAKTIRVGSTVTVPNRVSILGMNNRATTVLKTADVLVFDISGDDSSTRQNGQTFMGFTMDGGNNLSWTQPLIRTYYSGTQLWLNVNFQNTFGTTFDTTEFWDTSFFKCRWDRCGGPPGGSLPAMWLRNATASSGFGASTETTNAIRFWDCTFESFQAGGLWIGDENSVVNSLTDGPIEEVVMIGCKFDTTFVGGSSLRSFYKVDRLSISDTVFVNSRFSTGYSTPVNVVHFDGYLRDVWMRDCSLYSQLSSGSASTVRTFIRYSDQGGGFGISTNIGLDRVTMRAKTANSSPTVAGVEWASGGNYEFCLRDVKWRNDGDSVIPSAPLFSGSPGSFAGASSGTEPIPTFSGAGKTTVADTDFVSAPMDGVMAIARNTSDGRVYLGVRVNGSWKHEEMT